MHYPDTLAPDAISFVQQLLIGAPSRRACGHATFEHAFLAPYPLELLLSKELAPPTQHDDDTAPDEATTDEATNAAAPVPLGLGGMVCADVLMAVGLAAWSAASVEVAVAGASVVVAAAYMRWAKA